MSDKVVLLFESPTGVPYAVACNSRARADQIRDAAADECTGTIALYPYSVAIVGIEEIDS